MIVRDSLFRSFSILGINHLAFNTTRNALRVLCYHGVWSSSRPHFGNKIFMSPGTFAARLDVLKTLRFNVLPLTEALGALDAGALPPRSVAITIDDGWASTFEFMLPELLRRRFPATVYVQTQKVLSRAPVFDVAISYAFANSPKVQIKLPREWTVAGTLAQETDGKFDIKNQVDRRGLFTVLENLFAATPQGDHLELLCRIFELFQVDQGDLTRTRVFQLGTAAEIRQAASAGFEIALHTHSHTLGDFSSNTVEREIGENRAALAEILGRPESLFKHFCWPSGRYTADTLKQLAALGITVATSCKDGFVTRDSPRLLLPRILDGELTSPAEFVACLSGARNFSRAINGFSGKASRSKVRG